MKFRRTIMLQFLGHPVYTFDGRKAARLRGRLGPTVRASKKMRTVHALIRFVIRLLAVVAFLYRERQNYWWADT